MRPIYVCIAAAAIILGSALFFPACKGSTGPAGPPGTSAVPAPYCSSPSSHGYTAAGSTNLNIGCCFLVSEEIALASSSTAVSISLLVASGPVSGQVLLGLYANGSGVPGNLIAESDYTNLATGWVSAAIPPTYLAAGSYWIAMNYSNSFPVSYTTTGGTEYEIAYPWGQMPQTFPTGNANAYYFPLYISTCP